MTVEYVLRPNVIDKLAVAVTEKFNESLQNTDRVALLDKELNQVQKAIDGFLSAIAAGIVTKSTKRKLLELEQQSDESESKIAVETARQTQPLDCEKVKVFLNYFAKKQYQNDEEKNEFFDSFIYRVVLFDDCVYIFYNTSPKPPLKFKLDEDDLSELSEYRENRKSTQFVPLGFKLGALGGRLGIRTPGCFHINGFQDRRFRPLSQPSVHFIIMFLAFVVKSYGAGLCKTGCGQSSSMTVFTEIFEIL